MKFEKWSNANIRWGLLPIFTLPSTLLTESLLNSDETFSYQTKISFWNNKKNTDSCLQLYSMQYCDYSDTIFNRYQKFRYSSFIDFFERQNTDVPSCFKKSRSLRRFNFETPLIKFTNYLTKCGNKEKTFLYIAEAQQLVLNFEGLKQKLTNTYYDSWLSLYFLFNNSSFFKSKNFYVSFDKYLNITNDYFFKKKIKYHSYFSTKQQFTLKLLFFTQPLFTFSLYQLSKKARKVGKKKNTKYIFIWKYVPAYKRKNLLLKLIANDVKFNPGYTLKERLINLLSGLATNQASTNVAQTINFTNHYVFKNLRRTLLLNFRTTA